MEKLPPVTSMHSPDDKTMTEHSFQANQSIEGSQGLAARPVEISIIIVNYNVKDFLLQCLRSVERAMRNICGEIIVIDNHSTDGSIPYLQPLFPSVQFVSVNENLGFARGNNLGIEQARGDYLLFLNPDTLLEERTLEVMLEYMRRNPRVGMSGCRILNPDGTLQLACRRSFPSPWASFCKSFGLQRLFPKSHLFAQYNQTFRRDDETHFVDAISGSFMFVRREALAQIGGFDPQFFMFGEDLDLCFRVSKAGWKITYTPDTSLIHFKGESTKRSSIDRVKVFYEAMEVYARKHHGRSSLLLLMVRLGILLRSVFAYANRYRRTLLMMTLDAAAANGALLLATRLRFGRYFGFPPYAYPVVFFALTAVVLSSMLTAGEYAGSRPSLRRGFAGLMLSFFLLSSITSFFRDFAFSRGVLLMVITFSIILTGMMRILVAVYDKSVGKEADRRIAIVGMSEQAARIIKSLQSAETRNADLIGIISGAEAGPREFQGLPVIGHISYLSKLIEEYRLQEIIITDDLMKRSEMLELMANSSQLSVRFHLAMDYEDIIASRIINEIAGIESAFPPRNSASLRYRIFKRLFDLMASFLLLIAGLPFICLFSKNIRQTLSDVFRVFRGERSVVGIYPGDPRLSGMAKIGLTGLAHISKPERLSAEVIRELNEYYIRHCTVALDVDILFKGMIRRISLF